METLESIRFDKGNATYRESFALDESWYNPLLVWQTLNYFVRNELSLGLNE